MVTCVAPPALVVVHQASLALFISFWLPVAVGYEGEGDDAQGDDAGGGVTTRAGGRRDPDQYERGDDGAGGRDAGHSLTHYCVAPSAISHDLLDCPVLPTLLGAACPAGTETGRSGGYRFRKPPPILPIRKIDDLRMSKSLFDGQSAQIAYLSSGFKYACELKLLFLYELSVRDLRF